MFNTGNPGPLRLFNEPLGGQIVWLLPLALLSLFALAWQWRPRSQEGGEQEPRSRRAKLARFWDRRPRLREDRRQQSFILWGAWLLTVAVFFSAAGFFHQYYLSTLAPAVCALFGIGVVVMWQDYRRGGWRGWLLPLAILLTALEQIHIITSNPAWGSWLVPVIAVTCGLAVVALFIARLVPRLRTRGNVRLPVLSLALVALLLTSAIWSAVPGLENIAADLPTAGPTQSGAGGFPGGLNANAGGGRANNGLNVDTALVRYLEANRNGAQYLVAVASSNEADSLILATNQPVMAMGGFSGRDPILTTGQLTSLVAGGTVRFFLLNDPTRQSTRSGKGQSQPAGFFWFGRNSQTALTSWITGHCATVPANKWQSASTGSPTGMTGYTTQLYDCAGAK